MLKQFSNNRNSFNIRVDTSAAQSLFAEYLHWYAGYYHWFRDIQSRKNGKNIQAICRALCAKGLRTWGKVLCENSREIRWKWGKMRGFCSEWAAYRQIFTMLKNGRLKFQRFDQRLEKVRDCSASAAPLQASATPLQASAASQRTRGNHGFSGEACCWQK